MKSLSAPAAEQNDNEVLCLSRRRSFQFFKHGAPYRGRRFEDFRSQVINRQSCQVKFSGASQPDVGAHLPPSNVPLWIHAGNLRCGRGLVANNLDPNARVLHLSRRRRDETLESKSSESRLFFLTHNVISCEQNQVRLLREAPWLYSVAGLELKYYVHCHLSDAPFE